MQALLKGSAIKKIEKDFLALDYNEQLELLERLIHVLRGTSLNDNDNGNASFQWDHFYGIATGLWENEDAQNFIDGLRTDRL